MALYTSLTGLAASQTELSVISNNIANTGTNGFKRSRANFGDIISTSPMQSAGRSIGSGTGLKNIQQQFTQGQVASSLNVLDMALNGNGFFTVKSKSSGAEVSFTRNGSFSVDNERTVVDSSGNALQVFPTNDDGRVLATGLADTRSLRLPLTSGVPRPTSDMDITLNLPSDAEVIPNNPRYNLPPADPADPVVNTYAFDRNDQLTYNFSTSTTVYDSLGNPQAVEIYYVRTSSATVADPESTWDAHVFVGSTKVETATGEDAVELTFDTQGVLTGPGGAIPFEPINLPGADPLVFTLDHGTATSQISDPFSVTAFAQDGYPAGRLDGVSVDVNGIVRASYTNGRTQALGKLALAQFANPNGLKQIGDAHYSITGDSGDPLLGEAGTNGLGTILSGSLERSNVDITEELVSLITAQRNFQANAKAIETDSTMLQAIINIRS
jgi:flagellar hook protein FlgE